MKSIIKIYIKVILLTSCGFFLMIARNKRLNEQSETLDSDILISNLEFEKTNLRNGWDMFWDVSVYNSTWLKFIPRVLSFYWWNGKRDGVYYSQNITFHLDWWFHHKEIHEEHHVVCWKEPNIQGLYNKSKRSLAPKSE